jgi:putative transcriptional regulator
VEKLQPVYNGKHAVNSSMQSVNLTHHFLIAMPAMADPSFSKTLTYICEHNEQGALGLVVNRPTELMLEDMFDQLGIPITNPSLKGLPVLFGGPVQLDRGFVLHQPADGWQSTMTINQEVGLTTSLDILQAIAEGKGPRQALVTLGYSGWAPGQLEHELAQNAWLTVPASPGIMFELPSEQRLAAAIQLLGIDFSSLSDEVGHS